MTHHGGTNLQILFAGTSIAVVVTTNTMSVFHMGQLGWEPVSISIIFSLGQDPVSSGSHETKKQG